MFTYELESSSKQQITNHLPNLAQLAVRVVCVTFGEWSIFTYNYYADEVSDLTAEWMSQSVQTPRHLGPGYRNLFPCISSMEMVSPTGK